MRQRRRRTCCASAAASGRDDRRRGRTCGGKGEGGGVPFMNDCKHTHTHTHTHTKPKKITHTHTHTHTKHKNTMKIGNQHVGCQQMTTAGVCGESKKMLSIQKPSRMHTMFQTEESLSCGYHHPSQPLFFATIYALREKKKKKSEQSNGTNRKWYGTFSCGSRQCNANSSTSTTHCQRQGRDLCEGGSFAGTFSKYECVNTRQHGGGGHEGG